MRVLHIISKFGGGGLERRAIQTVKGLKDKGGMELLIVVYSKEVEYKEVLSLGVDIHYMESPGRKARCKELEDIIKEYQPAIVHSWLDRFPTELILLSHLKRRYGFKYIHGSVCDGNRISKLSTVWMAQKISFIFSDVIVSNSKAGLIAKDAPMSKSEIIYNGFDFARIPQILDKSKREELGVKTKYMVTMCGRVDGSKDWNAYIEVARMANEASLDVTFIAIGNGNRIEQYRKIVLDKGLNNVIFTGRRTDVEELIGLSDVCMLLSDTRMHAEGVSNFIMESMASGKPVIATRGGGTPEIVSDSINGYVVDNNTTEAYIRLKHLLENDTLREIFGKNALEEIHKRFTLDLMTENYYKLYIKLIKLE